MLQVKQVEAEPQEAACTGAGTRQAVVRDGQLQRAVEHV